MHSHGGHITPEGPKIGSLGAKKPYLFHGSVALQRPPVQIDTQCINGIKISQGEGELGKKCRNGSLGL